MWRQHVIAVVTEAVQHAQGKPDGPCVHTLYYQSTATVLQIKCCVNFKVGERASCQVDGCNWYGHGAHVTWHRLNTCTAWQICLLRQQHRMPLPSAIGATALTYTQYTLL